VRFSVALLPEHHETADPAGLAAAVRATAVAVEAAGLDAVFVTDHPAPDTRWLAGGGHQALEPTVALTWAAAATGSIRLHTHVYVLAYRNPFLAARSLASVDQLSGGRLLIGVAAGYLRPEFGALGVPFEERNERLDEALDVVTRLWGGQVVAGEGHGWAAKGVQQLPVTVASPRPPIWVGGNSLAAMRRAARLGDGWSPFPTPAGLSSAAKTAEIGDLTSLGIRIERFRELCAELDRPTDLDVCMGPFSAGEHLAGRAPASALVEELAAMEDLGVTWTTIGFPGGPAEVVDAIARFAEEVVAPLAAR
jgi:probable F420-dependent oxidoreductase